MCNVTSSPQGEAGAGARKRGPGATGPRDATAAGTAAQGPRGAPEGVAAATPHPRRGAAWHAAVWVARCAVASLLLGWWLCLEQVDAYLASAWPWVLQQWWFRHDSFEPGISTLSFLAFLPAFAAVDCAATQLLRSSSTPSAVRRLLLALRSQPESAEDLKAWVPDGSASQELLVYVVPIFSIDFFFPRREARLAAEVVPTSTGLVGDVLLSLFLYDLFFTAVHYACHKVPTLYRTVHAKHHERQVVRARDTVRLSVVEEVLDVLCSVAALNLLQTHQLSRGVYDVVIVYLLCELHSGWDCPWQLQHVVPFGLWGGSARHTVHHTNSSVYYQKFFTYIDDWLLSPQGAAGKQRLSLQGQSSGVLS